MALVKLNVGGTIFITKKSTLTQSHFFKTLLDDEKFADKREDGSYFIDEDPVLFRHLLNRLRHPDYQFPEADLDNLNKLVDFYEIPSVETNKKLNKMIMHGLTFKTKEKEHNHLINFHDIAKIKTICFKTDNRHYLRLYHDNDLICDINLYVDDLLVAKGEEYFLKTEMIILINKYTFNKMEIIKDVKSHEQCEGYVDYYVYK